MREDDGNLTIRSFNHGPDCGRGRAVFARVGVAHGLAGVHGEDEAQRAHRVHE